VERDERGLADDLDRYWDALLRGDASPAPAALDADLATLAARLHAAGRALPPLFPKPDDAWRELRRRPVPPTVGSDGEAEPSPAWPHPNGRVALASVPAPAMPGPRRGGWLVSQLATAALLLLTLAVGLLAVWHGAPDTPDGRRWVPALSRAIAAAPGGIVDTPLVEATFSPAELPAGEREAVYYRLTIQPGASTPFLGGLFCGCRFETITKGVGIEIVEEGAYTVRLDAPLRVQRAGSTRLEQIPAGTDVTLFPGDAAIYPNYAAAGDIRNAGDEKVVLTGVVINATEASGTRLPMLPSGISPIPLTYTTPTDWDDFPPGALHVGLRRVILPPETSIGPYEPVGLQGMRVVVGPVERGFVARDESEPTMRPFPQSTGSTIPMFPLPAGVREIIANDGENPAELFVLIIEPEAISAQDLAP
jgi:hypothetical protein